MSVCYLLLYPGIISVHMYYVCMYVCMYICIINVCICIRMYVCMYVCIMYICNMYVYMYIYLCTYLCVMYVYVCVCVYGCMYYVFFFLINYAPSPRGDTTYYNVTSYLFLVIGRGCVCLCSRSRPLSVIIAAVCGQFSSMSRF